MTYAIVKTPAFERDVKRLTKKHFPVREWLEPIVQCLANGEKLPPQYRDHQLGGDMKLYRECHIERSDKLVLLYIYSVNEATKEIKFERLGTHDEILRNFKQNR